MANAPTSLDQARALARILDNLVEIPGTKYKVGIDPLIGLIPGLGDAVGATLAGYHVLLAAKLGAPTSLIVRMLGNVGIDMVVGAIPFVGDLFDVAWKASSANLALLEGYIKAPAKTRTVSRAVVTGAVVTLVLFAVLGVVGAVFVLGWTMQLLRSLF